MRKIVSRPWPILAVLLAIGGLLAACGSSRDQGYDPPMPTLPPPATAPRVAPEALAAPRWEVLLSAGSPTMRVEDDTVLELDSRLQAAGTPFDRIQMLSADHDRYSGVRPRRDEQPDPLFDDGHPAARPRGNGETLPSRPAVLARELLHLDGTRGGACFAYVSGTMDGDALAMLDGTIAPADLDRALSGGCADAPTVVVISACGSGVFAAPPMARPNRLIITAAPQGKSGFGCGPNVGFTTFDECFLGATDGAPTWTELFDRTRRCVLQREHLVQQDAAPPAMFIGPAVATLRAPWATVPPPDGVARHVQFSGGVGRFVRSDLPFFSTLKARNLAAAEAYARAPSPKALALTFAGTVAWVAGGPGSAGESPEDVARLALQRCEWRSGGACVLYARNDDLTAAGPGGQPPIHPPMLVRRGPLDVATVPFIRDDQRSRIEAYRHLAGPKALALGPDNEAIGTGTGVTTELAEQAALARCNEAGGGACVLFATDDRVRLAPP